MDRLDFFKLVEEILKDELEEMSSAAGGAAEFGLGPSQEKVVDPKDKKKKISEEEDEKD